MDPLLSIIPPTVPSVYSGRTSIAIVPLRTSARSGSPLPPTRVRSSVWAHFDGDGLVLPAPDRHRLAGRPVTGCSGSRAGLTAAHEPLRLGQAPPDLALFAPVASVKIREGGKETEQEHKATQTRVSGQDQCQQTYLSEHNRKEKERKRRVVNPPAAALGSSRHRPLSTQPYLHGPNSIGFLRRTLAPLRIFPDVL